MGERGPPQKPTILKLIAGNPGGGPLNVHESIPAPMASAEPPPELAGDEQAIACWRRLVPDLAACGLARSVDWPVLVRYCLRLSRWLYLEQQIKENIRKSPATRGTTYPIHDSAGKVKYIAEYPWAIEWRGMDRELRNDERAIGISPAARTRIAVKTDRKSEQDLRRDFLRNRGTA